MASLDKRTPEQVAEEDALYLELEKLKENERRFKRDREELLRTLCGIESGLPDIQVDEDGMVLGANVEAKQKKKKGVAGSVEPQTPVTPSSATVIALPQPPKKTSTKSSAAYGMDESDYSCPL